MYIYCVHEGYGASHILIAFKWVLKYSWVDKRKL